MEQKYKILIFALPGTGHINPLFPVIKQLAKIKQLKTIVYLSLDFKPQFDAIGVELREVKNLDIKKFTALVNSSSNDQSAPMKYFLDISNDNIEYLAKEIDREKPDLIVYDMVSTFFKWIVSYYNKWYKIKLKTNQANWFKLKFCPDRPFPPLVGFSPCFVFNANIYPNKFEQSMLVSFSFKLLWGFLKILFYQLKFCLKFGLKFQSPMDVMVLKLDDNHKFAFVSLLSDIQPRSHLFDQSKYKFVGATFEENKIEPLADQEPFVSIFNKFQIGTVNQQERLIYVSLGTIFNNSLMIYQKIIDSLKLFDSNKNLKLTVIISINKNVYDTFQDLIANKKLIISSNIYLVQSAPQIAVLKRVSLFITHSGMNSVSESVHFGVPMICVPVGADQPLVAYRIADELGLGLRLDYKTMEPENIYLAIEKVLNDQRFKERVQRYADISRDNKGSENACELIMNCLRQMGN